MRRCALELQFSLWENGVSVREGEWGVALAACGVSLFLVADGLSTLCPLVVLLILEPARMGPLRPSPGPGGQRLLLPPLLLALLLLLAPSASHTTQVVYKVPEEQPPNTLIGSLAADYGLPDVGHLYKLEVGAPYL